MKKVRYIDLPKGARFKLHPDHKDVWVVLEQHGRGKIAMECSGLVTKTALPHQPICCMVEEEQDISEVYVYPVWRLTDLAEAAKAVRQAYIELADLDFGQGSIGTREGDLAVVKLNDLLKEYGL